MNGYVYFVGNKQQVKIGKSINIESRISSIKTSSPVEIEILAKISCASISDTEAMLHKIFKDLCYKGEWFYRVGCLDELVTKLQTYAEPNDFTLGYVLGQIKQRSGGHKEAVYQHRLRAVYQALLKMKFDINSEQFHELQNKFIDGLVQDHPDIYKQYHSRSDGVVMEIIDAPHQPYPSYEYSILSTPIEED